MRLFFNTLIKMTFCVGLLIIPSLTFAYSKSGGVCTVNTAGADQYFTDTQNACDDSDCDIVVIPAGSHTGWPNDLEITLNRDITLKGGDGTRDQTTITIANSFTDNAAIEINGGNGYTFRMYGINVNGNNDNTEADGISFEGTSGTKDFYFAIGRCEFIDTERPIVINETGNTGESIYGVFYDGEIKNPENGSSIKGGGSAESWNVGWGLGTANAVFFENIDYIVDVAKGEHWFASNFGSSYVVRYSDFDYNTNTDTFDAFDVHGLCNNACTGSYMFEFYENTINMHSSDDLYRLFHIRGGQGVIWNNTFVGSLSGNFIEIHNYRSSDDCEAACLATTCAVANNDSLQHQCADEEGYPCAHQVNDTNNNGGPLYAWNNTDDGVQQYVSLYSGGADNVHTTHFKGERDWADGSVCNDSSDNDGDGNTDTDDTLCDNTTGQPNNYTPYGTLINGRYYHPLRDDLDALDDETAPVISNGSPSGTIACSGSQTLSVDTDENATCKYDTSDTAYGSMANTFSTTGGTSHSQELGLACDASYTYYVRCQDAHENANSSSTEVSWAISAESSLSGHGGAITITSSAAGGGTGTIGAGGGTITLGIQ